MIKLNSFVSIQDSNYHALGPAVKRMQLIHYLGTLMDTNLTFKIHTTHVCKKAMINLQRITLIRVCLTKKTAETLVLSLVISHLDYANVILADLAENTKKSEGNFENLTTLHWLPVRLQINFKILCIVYKCLK